MENKRLYGLICRLQRHMRRENNSVFAEFGVTPVHLDCLIFVSIESKRGAKVCQRDIERHVNLRPSSVSSLITTLEKNGFILRTVAEGDARTKYITLTEKGKTLCIKHKLLMDKCDSLIEAALDEEEQQTLKTLLNKIISAIGN